MTIAAPVPIAFEGCGCAIQGADRYVGRCGVDGICVFCWEKREKRKDEDAVRADERAKVLREIATGDAELAKAVHQEAERSTLERVLRAFDEETAILSTRRPSAHSMALRLRSRLERLVAPPSSTTPQPTSEASTAIEMELRREWWLNHGCPIQALYGDDGEMQCNNVECRLDFKRLPLDELRAGVQRQRIKRFASIAHLLPDNSEPMPEASDGKRADGEGGG